MFTSNPSGKTASTDKLDKYYITCDGVAMGSTSALVVVPQFQPNPFFTPTPEEERPPRRNGKTLISRTQETPENRKLFKDFDKMNDIHLSLNRGRCNKCFTDKEDEPTEPKGVVVSITTNVTTHRLVPVACDIADLFTNINSSS